MRIVGVTRMQDRPVFVFEDGTLGMVVGLRDKDAPDSANQPEPVLLLHPPLPLVGEIPEDKRLALTRPKLFDIPYTVSGTKSTLYDD